VEPIHVPVTLSEIAQVAGVSVSTVSRALNRSDYSVREATRNRILKIADDLNYKPNLNARGLRRNRSYAIGIIADNIADPFTAQVVSGIADYLRAGAYSTVFVHARARDDDNAEDDAIADLTLHTVDGFIFVHPRFAPSPQASHQTSKPYVFVNRGYTPGIITVGPDNYYDAQVMTGHLLTTQTGVSQSGAHPRTRRLAVQPRPRRRLPRHACPARNTRRADDPAGSGLVCRSWLPGNAGPS
jgi:DNA-binding LacI/PurR family transcriptional regulator